MKNNEKETALTNLTHIAFVQGVNIDTIITIVIASFFPTFQLNFTILFFPFIVMCGINIYLYYYKLSNVKKNTILSRKPRYNVLIYDLYNLLSTILFFVSLYFASIRR